MLLLNKKGGFVTDVVAVETLFPEFMLRLEVDSEKLGALTTRTGAATFAFVGANTALFAAAPPPND